MDAPIKRDCDLVQTEDHCSQALNRYQYQVYLR